MRQYIECLRDILLNGVHIPDRTKTGTKSIFSKKMDFDLSTFPLLTTKKVHLKSVLAELLWFISGGTNIRDLHKDGVTIWDEWADENGDLGPVYGAQWRSWPSYRVTGGTQTFLEATGSVLHENASVLVSRIDQLSNLIEGLRKDPHSRRHLVSAWNPQALPEMALMPCHLMFQVYARPLTILQKWETLSKVDRTIYSCADLEDPHICVSLGVSHYALDCQVYQRSH